MGAAEALTQVLARTWHASSTRAVSLLPTARASRVQAPTHVHSNAHRNAVPSSQGMSRQPDGLRWDAAASTAYASTR